MPEQIVETVLQEDADAVGLSILAPTGGPLPESRDGERHRDRQQQRGPQHRCEHRGVERPRRVRGRSRRVAEQRAHGRDHRADRVPLRDLLQPVGQAAADERVGQERQRERSHEDEALHRVRGPRDHAEQRPNPDHRAAEGDEQDHAGQRLAPLLSMLQPIARPVTQRIRLRGVAASSAVKCPNR